MGLPVWRSPSPAAEPRDATKPSRSPIRRPRRQRSTISATAARLENAASGSTSYRYPLWDHVRIPERREEVSAVSRPSRTDDSQGSSSQLPLPPAPELRSLTRSPVSMFAADGSNQSYTRSAFGRNPARELQANRLRNTLNQLEDRVDRITRDYQAHLDRANSGYRRPQDNAQLPNLGRRTPIWGQSSRRGDDDVEVMDFEPDRDTTAPRPTDVLEDFDFDRLLNEYEAGRLDPDALERHPTGAVEDFPPLRRMGRGPIVDAPLPSTGFRESWAPRSPIDGLGDRSRSFSPASDHWETMLTTIAPDANLPSADSSFTSAAASASFSASRSQSTESASHSASSSRTSLTVPSEQDRQRDQACDTDEDRPRSPPAVDPLTAGMRQRDLDHRLRRTESLRRIREHQRQGAERFANIPYIPDPSRRDVMRSPGRQRMHIRGPLFLPSPPPRISSPSEHESHESSDSSSSSSLRARRRRTDRVIAGFRASRESRHGSTSPDHISVQRPPRLLRAASLQEYLRTDGPGEDTLLRRPGQAPPALQNSASLYQFPSRESQPQVSAETREENRGAERDQDLDSLRAIVERLAQRDDIPEEWWMSVGLTPMFAGRLERVRRERETRERL